jgi:hypothetical protein
VSAPNPVVIAVISRLAALSRALSHRWQDDVQGPHKSLPASVIPAGT